MRPINRSPRLAVANLVDFIDKVWENRFWPPRRPKADKSRSKLTVIFRFNQKKKKSKTKKTLPQKGKGSFFPFLPSRKTENQTKNLPLGQGGVAPRNDSGAQPLGNSAHSFSFFGTHSHNYSGQ